MFKTHRALRTQFLPLLLRVICLAVLLLLMTWTTRLRADEFDQGFGVDGVAILDKHVQDRFTEFDVSSDGSIFALGTTYKNHNQKWNLIIAKFKSDGSLDPTFGGDGEIEVDIKFNVVDEPVAIRVLPNGKVLVLSRAGVYSYLSRYHSYGAPDNSFNDGWHAISLESVIPKPEQGPVGFPFFFVQGMTLWGDKAVICSHQKSIAVVNYDGTMNQNFGDGGIVHQYLAYNRSMKVSDMLVSGDQLYVYGKEYEDGSAKIPSVMCINDDGTLKMDFGDGGFLAPPNNTLDDTSSFAFHNGVFTLAGGNRILKMDHDGMLVSNFSVDGIVHLPEDFEVTDVVRQPYGMVAASVKIPADDAGYDSNEIAVVRFTADGVTDKTLKYKTIGVADDGWFRMELGQKATAMQLFSYANGKLLIAGDYRKNTGNENMVLIRLGAIGGKVDGGGGFDLKTPSRNNQGVEPSSPNWKNNTGSKTLKNGNR